MFRTTRLYAILIGVALVAGACGSGGKGASSPPTSSPPAGNTGSGAAPTGPVLNVDNFYAFSGVNAAFGPDVAKGCFPAVFLINQNGGILGHRLKCLDTDSKDDPADSVPLARQLVATTSHLVLLEAGDSDTGTAILPIFNQAGLPTFTLSGASFFDHSAMRYFWRNTPADDSSGWAMALAAKMLGYHRVALLFGNDINSQGSAPTARLGAKALNLDIVADQSVPLDQASYRSEVVQLVAAKPDAIITETDPQTTATYQSEVKQLGSTLPIVTDSSVIDPSYFKAVEQVLGLAGLEKYIRVAESTNPNLNSVAYEAFRDAALNSQDTAPFSLNPSNPPDPPAWLIYDSITLSALAMLVAHSTDPKVFNSYIAQVANPNPKATVVNTFAQGKAALLAGKQIRFEGIMGPMMFDQWHNSPGPFAIQQFTTGGALVNIEAISGSALSQLSASCGSHCPNVQ